MSDRELVLFANEAFYRAFADQDFEAMSELWAEHAPCSCIHPGWAPLHGRDQVLESWAAIIANPDSPDIACHAARATLYDATAVVICYEELAGQYLVATNVFVREGRLWKMVHHQAGPTTAAPDAGEPEDDSPVH